ncbi:MAG: hypothetical protein OZ921_09310, partial [Sorangiineae bacterium]|nr:hypothetical protein [Sorangiineae bacterium]
GGAGGTSSGGAGGGCSSSQKLCGGVCVAPTPGLGCALSGCDPCAPPPANSTAICTGNLCDFQCLAGYQRSGSFCQAIGGTGGGGGTGGSPGCASGFPCITGEALDPICLFGCTVQKKVGICLNSCCTCI